MTNVLSEPKLEFFKLNQHSSLVEIVPGKPERSWMDRTNNKFAYRCTPLTIANTSGWQFLSPIDFEITWDGGTSTDSLKFTTPDGKDASQFNIVFSHFGYGIVTFSIPYLVRTSPGWAIWVRGAPNTNKGPIVPLDGVVETDWLPFTFTMNWRMITPTTARFRRGEPFCFVTLVPHSILDSVEPIIRNIEDEPELNSELEQWSESRKSFNDLLNSGNDEINRTKWQKNYTQGKNPFGSDPSFHKSKRRLKCPMHGSDNENV